MTFQTTTTDKKTGAAIPGIAINAFVQDGRAFARSSDGSGYSDLALLGVAAGLEVQIQVIKEGYAVYSEAFTTTDANQEVNIQLVPFEKPHIFPATPTRDQVCGMQLTAQGLTVETEQYGPLPWFEPFITGLSPSDRQQVYAAKHRAGDTHLISGFYKGGQGYGEPGQPYHDMFTPDLSGNPPLYLSFIEEFILNGFIPVVVFDGDNGDADADGYPNALRQLPILVDLLRSSKYGDLNAYVLYARFWDGVFYGSSPENIAAFGTEFRRLLPNGYLAIEHNPGHIPCGEGGSDYARNGRMSTYDVICSEFENGMPRAGTQTGWDASTPPRPTYDGDTIWQIVGRLVHPYHRPPEQQGDPSAPFYLGPGSERGPYFYCALEFDMYRWVRNQVTVSEIEASRAYLRQLGCAYTG